MKKRESESDVSHESWFFLPRTICPILAFSLWEPAPRISTLKQQHSCQMFTLSQLEMLEKQVDTLILINSFDSKVNEVVLHSFTVTSPASSLAIKRRRIQNILKNLSWFMFVNPVPGRSTWSSFRQICQWHSVTETADKIMEDVGHKTATRGITMKLWCLCLSPGPSCGQQNNQTMKKIYGKQSSNT